MRARVVFGILSLAMQISVLTIASKACADPLISKETEYWDVSGHSVGEINDDMRRSGPIDDGSRFYAFTRWYVKWKYNFARKDDLCMLRNVVVSAQIKFTVPRLAMRAEVSPDVTARWDAFFSHLMTHETGHATHGMRAARDVEHLLNEWPITPCDRIAQQVNAEAKRVLGFYQQQDIDYDRSTQHGVTQGAVFR